MKGRTTLILLALALAMLGYIYLVEVKGKEKKDARTEESKKLLSVEENDIQRLSLSRPDESVACVKDSAGWRIVSPVSTEADNNTVKGWVSALATAKVSRSIENPGAWSDFGLEPPRCTFVFITASGLTDTLFVGDKNPTGSELFVRKPGNPNVLLTATSLETYATKSLFDLRDKTVIPFDKDKVQSLTLRNKNGEVRAAKSGDGWTITSPVQAKADKNAVDNLLSSVKGFQTKSVESETPDLGPYGLERPSAEITLTLGPEQSQKTLWLGSVKGNQVYAKDATRPAVFTVDTASASKLAKTLFDLRDKRVLEFNRDDVASIEVDSKDLRFACNKDTADNWIVTSPKPGKAKSWKVSGVISNAVNLEAVRFLEKPESDAKTGLTHPTISLKFKDGQGKVLTDLAVGNASGPDDVYVRNGSTQAVYLVKDGIKSQLTIQLDEWLENEEKAAKTDTVKTH